MKKRILSLLLSLSMFAGLSASAEEVDSIDINDATNDTISETYATDDKMAFYCIFKNTTDYHSFDDGKTYLLVKDQKTPYGGKDGIVTVPSGSAFLNVVTKRGDTPDNFSEGTDGYYKYFDDQLGNDVKLDDVDVYVDVEVAGDGFDHCKGGSIGYRTYNNEKRRYNTINGFGWWYYCWYGGVRFVGPFNAYGYTQVGISEDDIIIQRTKSINIKDGTTLTDNDINVWVKIGNTKYRIPYNKKSAGWHFTNGGDEVKDGKVEIDINNGGSYSEEYPLSDIVTTKEVGEYIPSYSVSYLEGSIKGSGADDYEAGETVSLSPMAVNGRTFDHWDVTGIELDDEQIKSENLSFTMPANEIVVRAIYNDTVIGTYETKGGSVSITKDGVDTQAAVEGDKITLTPIATALYTFDKFEVYKMGDSSKTIDLTEEDGTYSFTMPDYDVTVKPIWIVPCDVTFEDDDADSSKG